jgi:hypothetical protein
MVQQRAMSHAVERSTLADPPERVLDKGIIIAGHIRVEPADIELLSIQLRLVMCSVDKANEMGTDWWANNPSFAARRTMERWPALSPAWRKEWQGWRSQCPASQRGPGNVSARRLISTSCSRIQKI